MLISASAPVHPHIDYAWHSCVVQDKIGISNFFWSFKAESSTKLKNVESQCVESLKQAQVQLLLAALQLQQPTGSR